MKSFISCIEDSKLFIFDLNGTLVRPRWFGVAIVKTLLINELEIKINYKNAVKIIRYSDLNDVFAALQRYLVHKGVEIDFTKLKTFFDYYITNKIFTSENIPTSVFAREFIEYLKINQKKIALFTRSNKKITNMILGHLGWNRYFDVVITGDDVINTKPDPEGINKILDITNVENSSTILFDDSTFGILAGKKSNVITCLVGKKKSHLADFKIENYKEIYTKLTSHKY